MMTLSPSAMEVLGRICAAYADRPFAAEKAERLRPETLCRAELQLAILELRRAGLIELRQKVWGEQLFQIPPRQLAAVQQEYFDCKLEPVTGEQVAVEWPAEAGLAAQLFRTLVFIGQVGLPLTAKGGIHKKHSGRLAALLPVQDRHLQGVFPGSPASESVPLPVTVLLDLALTLGLVRPGDKAYQLEQDVLQSWLDLDESQMTSLLYSVILERYAAEEPALQHFRYLLPSPAFVPGSWYTLEDILNFMQQSGLAAGREAGILQQGCLSWLQCLAGFGWCELGMTDSGETCFRWTGHKPVLPAVKQQASGADADSAHPLADSEAAEGSFIIQPDFEVLVLPEVSYRLRWGLAGCAELLNMDDGIWSFRLSREGLEEAAERGLPPEEVASWLAARARGGLPDQVRLSLAQWSRSIGRTAWSQVILLVCQDEADAADIAAHPRLGDSLTRIGPLHFIVQQGRAEQVRKELAAAGLAPPRQIGGTGEGDEAQPLSLPDDAAWAVPAYVLPSPEGASGLLGSRAVLRTVPAVSDGAGEPLLPGEDSIPQMWVREWREYHTTTAQKVMEQAFRWGIKVRLSIDGEICDFIPEQLRGHPWRVAGGLMPAGTGQCEEAELAPGDWKEMKLLLPQELRNSSSA